MITFLKHQFNEWAHGPINTVDVVSGSVTLATILSWIPHATAVLSFAWICLRLYITIRDDLLKKKDK